MDREYQKLQMFQNQKIFKNLGKIPNLRRHSDRKRIQFVPFTPVEEKKPVVTTKPIPKSKKLISKKKLNKLQPKLNKTAKKTSKKAKASKTVAKPKNRNERLTPRDDIPDYKENPFFASKTVPDVYVSPRVFARLAIRHVKNKNVTELKKLIADKKRFPQNGLAYGFSYYDHAVPEMIAILSGDIKFYDEFMKLSRNLELEAGKEGRPVDETCLLQKVRSENRVQPYTFLPIGV